MLQESMKVILDNYNSYRFSQPGVDQNSSVYKIIEKELPSYIKGLLNDDQFKVSGSVGAGRWAEVPWIGIFNKNITTSAQKGFYVCYLFGNDMESIYLTIIHSITKEHSGKSWGKEQIKTFVQSKRENLKAHVRDLEQIIDNGIKIAGPSSFGSSSRANKYSESTIAYKEYRKENIPSDDILIKDLLLFMDLYDCMNIAENSINNSDGVEEMAYSAETGNVNVEVLKATLNVERKGAEVVFQNDDLFIISPSIQNGSDWFDMRKLNLTRFQESGKKGLLILRHGENFLIADLNDFFHQMMQEETMRSTSTGGDHWKFIIIPEETMHTVYNQSAKNILYKMKFATVEDLAKEATKIIRSLNPYSPVIKEEKPKLQLVKSDVEKRSSNELIPHIHQYINSKGFNYSLENLKNLYLSLRSKPFVIISGISGTGKTKIVQLFAESIGATEENGQFTLIPVRPDWSDGSELLGYKDIKGEFIEGPLTSVVREASNNLDRPYFVLLDEMNLARVEYYFSDVLSIMESRKKVGDRYTSSTLITVDEETLTLPGNLYIIGTVNMDETTHPFSKKVLDRANTIEFNEIHLDSFTFLQKQEEVDGVPLANTSIEASYVQLQDCFNENEQLIRKVSMELSAINRVIEPLNAHVGYRVRDEICFYMIHNNEGPLFDESIAFDYCIMQKILPRLAGSGLKIHTVLEQLYTYLTGDVYDEGAQPDTARYPQSAKKVYDMLGRLGDEGFTSFWIS